LKLGPKSTTGTRICKIPLTPWPDRKNTGTIASSCKTPVFCPLPRIRCMVGIIMETIKIKMCPYTLKREGDLATGSERKLSVISRVPEVADCQQCRL
jgi:hypothetical protein